jgi:hypothetical protein
MGLFADQVIASLRRDYAVVQADQSALVHKWLVSARPDTLPIGVLYAKGNTIIGVEYFLKGRESDSAQDLFDDLFESVSKLSAETHNRCTLTTWSGYVAEASLNKAGISFNCGVYQLDLKRIQVSAPDGKTATGYMLWEELGVTD